MIAFGSYTPDRYRWSVAGDWKALTKSFVKEGRSKGTATRFTNELRQFFEDDGSTLWVTFMRDRLYWGFLEGRPRAEPSSKVSAGASAAVGNRPTSTVRS